MIESEKVAKMCFTKDSEKFRKKKMYSFFQILHCSRHHDIIHDALNLIYRVDFLTAASSFLPCSLYYFLLLTRSSSSRSEAATSKDRRRSSFIRCVTHTYLLINWK